MDENCKRSGQIHIPAFGNWDYANDMPITQYFECARQAGLLRYSSSSGESDPYVRGTTTATVGDLYAVDDHHHHHRHLYKPSRYHAAVAVAPPRKTKRGSNVKEVQKRQVKKVCDVTEPPRKQQSLHQNFNNNNNVNKKKLHPQHDVVTATTIRARPPKAVDEDLYKIPPELLHSPKRKKMPGFFSCLVPACAS